MPAEWCYSYSFLKYLKVIKFLCGHCVLDIWKWVRAISRPMTLCFLASWVHCGYPGAWWGSDWAQGEPEVCYWKPWSAAAWLRPTSRRSVVTRTASTRPVETGTRSADIQIESCYAWHSYNRTRVRVSCCRQTCGCRLAQENTAHLHRHYLRPKTSC